MLALLPLAACADDSRLTIRSTNGDHVFAVEVVDTPEGRAKGLMFRTELAPDAGMLFDFHESRPVSFWMRNTLIPLDMLFITAEGLVAGKRYGLDPAVMVDVLNESTGGSWITQTHFHQRVFNRAFDDPFKLELMLKDMGIAVELARETATPAPLWGLGQQLWRMADHAAGPGASVSELVRWVEKQSGTELTPGAAPRRR